MDRPGEPGDGRDWNQFQSARDPTTSGDALVTKLQRRSEQERKQLVSDRASDGDKRVEDQGGGRLLTP